MKKSFANQVNALQQLDSGLTANAEELTFLAEDHAALQGLINQIKAADTEQEALKAQLQTKTQELDGLIADAKSLESCLRASLKGKYGAKNEILEAFGIKVRR